MHLFPCPKAFRIFYAKVEWKKRKSKSPRLQMLCHLLAALFGQIPRLPLLCSHAKPRHISQGKLVAVLELGSSNIYLWANEICDPGSERVIPIIEASEEINLDAALEFRKLYMEDDSQRED